MIHLTTAKKSLGFAMRGVKTAWKTEQSFRIQSCIGVLVVIVGWVAHVDVVEYSLLLLMVGAVLVLELLNTIIERLLDAFKPRIHPLVKEAKDMMAGAVLIASITAAIIGVCILWPYMRL